MNDMGKKSKNATNHSQTLRKFFDRFNVKEKNACKLQCFSTRDDLAPQGRLAMSGDVLGCHYLGSTTGI